MRRALEYGKIRIYKIITIFVIFNLVGDSIMETVEEKNEIFEEKVSDTPVPEIAPEPEQTEVKTEVKKKKAKRVISEEQRQKLKENLARGRATSLANRQKKAKLKKIKKEEESKAEDEKIFESLKKKLQPDVLKGENEALKKELEMLRSEMRSMKERKVERPSTPPPTSKPEKIQRPLKERKKREKTAATEDSDDDAPAPAPVKKEMSKREIMKMMRGL